MVQGMLAAALGAATGTVLALMMGALWPLGALLGGLTGYLSYNVREVVQSVRRTVSLTRCRIFARRWPALLWGTLALTCMAHTSAILLLLVVPEMQTPWNAWRFLMIATLSGLSFGFFMGLITATDSHPPSVQHFTQSFRWMAINMNVAALTFYWVPVLLFRTAKWLLSVLQLSALMLRLGVMAVPHVVRDVYSEKRLIAGLSAFQGAVVGYFAHDWIFAGVAGLSFFVLQVTLIHRRLAPQRRW